MKAMEGVLAGFLRFIAKSYCSTRVSAVPLAFVIILYAGSLSHVELIPPKWPLGVLLRTEQRTETAHWFNVTEHFSHGVEYMQWPFLLEFCRLSCEAVSNGSRCSSSPVGAGCNTPPTPR